MELPPSWFVQANAIWGECLNYRGEREWGLIERGRGSEKIIFPAASQLRSPPLGSLDTLPRSRSLLQTKMAAAPSNIPGTNYGRVLGVSFVVSHLQPYHLTHDLFLLCKENRYENTHEPTVNKSLSWQPKLILMVTLILLHPSSPLTPPPPPTPPFFYSFPFWGEKGRGGLWERSWRGLG